jgi:pimeloyl-ACP methyl ester carboxylesterase
MVDTARSADGTKIAYERTGDGPVLILAGGALNNRRSADALVPLLAEQFSVVAFDRRGRGDSTDTPPYAPAREVEDLKALIDAVGGSAMVFGHSSGAVLSLEAAADCAAITRLAVNEPPYLTGTAETGSATLREIEAALDAGDRGTAVEIFIRGTGVPFDPAMKRQPWFAGLEAVAHTLPYDLALVGDSSVPVDRLAKITAPTLGLYGGASPAWAAASISAVIDAIPGATKKVLEGQTHAADPAVLAPVLIDYFGRPARNAAGPGVRTIVP